MAAEERRISLSTARHDVEIVIATNTVPFPDGNVQDQQEHREGGHEEKAETEEDWEIEKDRVEENREKKRRRRTSRRGEGISPVVVDSGGGGFSFSFDTTTVGSPNGTTPKFGSFGSRRSDSLAIDAAVDFGIRKESSEIGGEL